MTKPTLMEFYNGGSVFVTGATGFVGKVLVEKLLRSCTGLEKVYILIRTKRGKTPAERIAEITNLPLFKKLKKEQPNAIKDKLRPVIGDVTELGLGLSEEDRKLLTENVSIIFHGAASVRFDDNLTRAILLNTRGTREVISLAREMKKLKVFLHISTTYCNTDRMVVEEEFYPAPLDWKKSIAIAENTDEHVLQMLTLKYMDKQPNTYTFTKRLSENAVFDLCQDKLPAVVFRPSIVISTRYDPVPGWIDNFNGPVGLLVASGKGIMRSCYTVPTLRPDYMPVDIAVRALLMAAWQKGTAEEDKLDVKFYNCSNNETHTITMKELIAFGKQIMWDAPMSTILWYPSGDVTDCIYYYYLIAIFLHALPAAIIDVILKLFNRKPFLLKIQRRIYIANMFLQYFLINQWTFKNEKCRALDSYLPPEEVEDFGYNVDNVNIYEYFRNCLVHGRVYLLKESNATLAPAKVTLYRMYVLHIIFKIVLYSYIYWLFVYKLDAFGYAGHKIHRMYEGVMWQLT